MVPFIQALENVSINAKGDFNEIGKTSWCGSKKYLSFDEQTGWSVVQLNLIERIFRKVFGYCKHTTKLNNIICAVCSETQRKDLTWEQHESMTRLLKKLVSAFFRTYKKAPTDWRVTYYPNYYAPLWNKEYSEDSKSFPPYPVIREFPNPNYRNPLQKTWDWISWKLSSFKST